MEVASSTQEVGEHAAFLLANLKLQRDSTLFCDCVIRRRQNPAHLYQAHRCVLAASSPVFAALLSSTGNLLELCDPCLSDSALALVLDYIYTGNLPPPAAHQHYYSLITAAGYLQMDGLQEALRARQLTEVKSSYMGACMAQNQLYSDNKSTINCSTTPNLPYSHNINTSGEYCEEIYDQLNKKMSCFKREALKTLSSGNVNNVYGITPVSTVSTLDTPCIAAVNTESSKEERAQTRSPGSAEQEELQVSREEEDEEEQKEERRARVEKRGFGEVPVICHTSKVPRLQLEAVHALTALPPQAATGSHGTAFHHPAGQSVHCGKGIERRSDGGKAKSEERQDSLNSESQAAQVECSHMQAGEELASHCSDQRLGSRRAVTSLPVSEHDSGSYATNQCSGRTEERNREEGHHSRQNIVEKYGMEGVSSLQSTVVHVECTLSASSQAEMEEGHFGSNPPLKFENNSDSENSEPNLTAVMAIVNNICSPVYNGEEETYHGRYHCMPSEASGVAETHSCTLSKQKLRNYSNSSPVPFDQSNVIRSSGNPNHCPLTHSYSRETGTEILLLDISTSTAQLHVFHQTAGGERGIAVGDGESGVRTWDHDQEHGAVAKLEALIHKRCTDSAKSGYDNKSLGERDSVVVARRGTFEARTQVGRHIGTGADCDCREEASSSDAVCNVEATGLVTSLGACMSPGLPDIVPATTSPTLPACTPKTFPVSGSGCLSNPHQHPYQCLLCDRSFSQRGSLNRHMRSHLGVRPYPCPHCPMTFSRQYRVTEHMRVHQRCILGGDLLKPPGPFT